MTIVTAELFLAAADVELMVSGRPPTISVVGYTGGMMRVPPFGDLVIVLAGLQLSGDPIPILADHDSSLRGIIERVRAGETIHINNRTIQSPQTAFSLVRSGELREISLVALGADAAQRARGLRATNLMDLCKAAA